MSVPLSWWHKTKAALVVMAVLTLLMAFKEEAAGLSLAWSQEWFSIFNGQSNERIHSATWACRSGEWDCEQHWEKRHCVCLAVLLLKGGGSSSGNTSGGRWCCTAAGLEVGHLMPVAHWWKYVCKDVWGPVWHGLQVLYLDFHLDLTGFSLGSTESNFSIFDDKDAGILGYFCTLALWFFDAEQVYFKLQVTNINIQEATTN